MFHRCVLAGLVAGAMASSVGAARAGEAGSLPLQSLLPNGDFDADLGHWSPMLAGAASWDGTEDAAGAPGSGSAKILVVDPPDPRVVGLAQCVLLPGPGTYALNGWGRTLGTAPNQHDSVILAWEFRKAGGSTCSNGSPDASGDHVLAVLSTWRQPSQPARFTVSESDWTPASSLAIALVVVDGGVASPTQAIGWFDGITLDWNGDPIFRDGFDGGAGLAGAPDIP